VIELTRLYHRNVDMPTVKNNRPKRFNVSVCTFFEIKTKKTLHRMQQAVLGLATRFDKEFLARW